MLLKCPECELQVSDKAVNCPHCGYPMQNEGKKKRKENVKQEIVDVGYRMALVVFQRSKEKI